MWRNWMMLLLEQPQYRASLRVLGMIEAQRSENTLPPLDFASYSLCCIFLNVLLAASKVSERYCGLVLGPTCWSCDCFLLILTG